MSFEAGVREVLSERGIVLCHLLLAPDVTCCDYWHLNVDYRGRSAGCTVQRCELQDDVAGREWGRLLAERLQDAT